MKISKVLVAAAAMTTLAAPAMAIEADFTGFLQARGFMYNNLDGNDDNDDSVRGGDQRFRLWTNAALNENVKSVFAIEVDTLYGGTDTAGAGSGGGDIGADSKDIEVKNAYLDFNIPTWNTNVKVGAQPWQLGRGLILGDDASGVQVRYTPVEGQSLAFYYVNGLEGSRVEKERDDLSYYQVQYDMKVAGWNVAPYVGYLDGALDLETYYLGANVDGKVGPVTLGATAIVNSWEQGDTENEGFALWGKATYAVAPPTALSFEAAYYGDDENDGVFQNVGGYNNFSEIVTGGRFDARTGLGGDQTAGGAFRNNVGTGNDSYNMNFMYVKLGAEHKYSDTAKVSAYYIYSQEAEDRTARDNMTFGHELDAYYDHEVVKGLTFTLAGAYLLADNDFGAEDDAWKLGTALTYKF